VSDYHLDRVCKRGGLPARGFPGRAATLAGAALPCPAIGCRRAGGEQVGMENPLEEIVVLRIHKRKKWISFIN